MHTSKLTKCLTSKVLTSKVFDDKNFVNLNSNVTVIYLRFIKSIYFYAIKQNNETLMWFFSSKKTFNKIKRHLPENFTFQGQLNFSISICPHLNFIDFWLQSCETVGKGVCIKIGRGRNPSTYTMVQCNLILVTWGKFQLHFWSCQFLYYMKVGFSAGTLCQGLTLYPFCSTWKSCRGVCFLDIWEEVN